MITASQHKIASGYFIALVVTCFTLSSSVVAQEEAYQTLEWNDLLPLSDWEALSNPPGYITGIEDGSIEDQMMSSMEGLNTWEDDPYQQALVSRNVVEEFDGKNVRLPGFVVPLEFNDDLTITQFFLVPYFGACIHLPAPAPNQTVLVNFPEGMAMEALYTPFWVSGEMQTEITENNVATSAYAIEMHEIEVYSP
ncbi:MAG: DUF3299 domain-containing protein [Porticoccaceae bacterium]|jgi:uncharacterized protein|nr:DUF3299 domain-containing protein [Porticoccaceae bacterium]